MQTQETTNLIVSQGFKDAREFRRFLVSHGRQGYKVFADVDDYAPYDAVMLSVEGEVSYIELKERRVMITDYPDCAVDASKIRGLQRIKQETGRKVFLVALYPMSGQVAIWRISADEYYHTETRRANSRTVWQGGPRAKMPKEMVKLPLATAKIYTHTFEQL